MKKINFGIFLLAVILTVSAKAQGNADNSAVAQSDNQVVNDEGYGNDDAEYYNSEDDRNGEEAPGAQNEVAGNDAR